MKRSSYIALGVSILVVIGILYFFSDIVAYVLIAWVLSMVGRPLMNILKHLGNNLGAALTLGIFMATFSLLVWIFIPPMVQQARNLAQVDYAKLVTTLEEPINRLNNYLVEKGLMDGEIVKKDTVTVDPINESAVDSLTKNEEIIEDATPDEKRNDEEDEPEEDSDFEILGDDDDTSLPIDSSEYNNLENELNQNQFEYEETDPDSSDVTRRIITPSGDVVEILPIINYDSLRTPGDTIENLNIAINIEITQPQPDPIKEAPTVKDPTAEIKHTDTPIEKIQKKLFSAFNPAQIQDLFSGVLGFLGNLMIAIASIIFISFFFLREENLFGNFLKAFVSDQYENQVLSAVEESSNLLRRYFMGVTLQVLTITLYMWLLLHLIGIESALLIAFFAALINVIPYIGPIIGAIFGVFITISSNLDLGFYNEMLPMILWVMAAFFSMQMLDNFLLQPVIFSTSVKAHPLEIFIIILIGAKIAGIGGMVAAIPFYTVIRVIAKSFLSEFKLVQRFTQKMDTQPVVDGIGELNNENDLEITEGGDPSS